MAIYLCRLRPPRPAFPGDTTEAERHLMGEHAAYWAERTGAGPAIVFGPVMDPAGIWGAAVVDAEDEAEASRLVAADPVIRASAGFRYDVMAMPGAMARRVTET